MDVGYPTDDTKQEYQADAVRERLYFERGMIYAGPGRSFVVNGEIDSHRARLDGLTGILGSRF